MAISVILYTSLALSALNLTAPLRDLGYFLVPVKTQFVLTSSPVDGDWSIVSSPGHFNNITTFGASYFCSTNECLSQLYTSLGETAPQRLYQKTFCVRGMDLSNVVFEPLQHSPEEWPGAHTLNPWKADLLLGLVYGTNSELEARLYNHPTAEARYGDNVGYGEVFCSGLGVVGASPDLIGYEAVPSTVFAPNNAYSIQAKRTTVDGTAGVATFSLVPGVAAEACPYNGIVSGVSMSTSNKGLCDEAVFAANTFTFMLIDGAGVGFCDPDLQPYSVHARRRRDTMRELFSLTNFSSIDSVGRLMVMLMAIGASPSSRAILGINVGSPWLPPATPPFMVGCQRRITVDCLDALTLECLVYFALNVGSDDDHGSGLARSFRDLGYHTGGSQAALDAFGNIIVAAVIAVIPSIAAKVRATIALMKNPDMGYIISAMESVLIEDTPRGDDQGIQMSPYVNTSEIASFVAERFEEIRNATISGN